MDQKIVTAPYDVEAIRRDFPILAREVHGKPLVYLDNGASAQKPQVVLDAIQHAYASEYANVHRGLHFLSNAATDAYEKARESVRRFLNAPSTDNIVFTSNSTAAINTVAYGFGMPNIGEGDEIVLSILEHHSNIVPWHFIRERRGAKLVWVPVDDLGALHIEDFEKSLTERTKLVAITHMSNALGTITPIKEICRIAHQRGIPVLVDGSQSAVHMPIDVQDLDCDFFAFTGHKVYGPSGIGVLYGKKEMLRTLGACGLDPESQVARQWAALAQTLMGFPRHLSQHPGGFVISRGKLSRLVPIENAAMADRSVVQWDKDDLDALKLLKVDVLALGMLSALRRTLELAGQRRGRPLRLQDIPEGDEPTYDMICEADTIGVFQIESRAQMSMLPRLRPRKYYDLVVQVAIVRPGPIQGGMVHPYLRRRQGKEKETYPSEKVRGVLSRTMGVPIFQEQVMQIAVVAAGFTPGDADQLRRSMAAWKRKGGVDKYRVKLVGGLLAHGYTLDFAEALFRQIEGFGEYGFPESHAASFALLAYASSWLKRHEPEAFLAALLNSQPMGFYPPAQLVQDARRHGVRVLPADVTVSGWDAALETAPADAPPRRPHPHAPASDEIRPAVRLGLSLIQGLHEDSARRIEAARADAPFTSTGDLARRAALTRHDLNALAAGDALLTLAGHRRQASWEAAASVHSRDLLRDAAIHETETPRLAAPTENQTVAADYRSVGLTLRRHPVELLRPQLAARNFQPASVLNGYPDKRVARACGIVTVRQRPQTSKGVIFVTLEDETGPVNVVVRPELIERQRRELLASSLLGVYGSWQSVDGVRHLIAQRLVDLSDLLGGLSMPSRNFH